MNELTVQVPAFREPEIGTTLEAIARQRPPDNWRVRHEAWVTPDNTGNETLAAVEDNPTFEAYEAPRGKLSARNAAHGAAFAADAAVVVTWDADSLPAHDGVLAALVGPLADDSAVATNGNPTPVGLDVLTGTLARAAVRIEQTVRPHLNGQLSAFTARGWSAAGPFDEAVDQTDVRNVRAEEEFGFHRRLRRAGTVRFAEDAMVEEDPRRILHHFEKAWDRFSLGRHPRSEWSQQRGQETFMPKRD